MTVYDSVKVPNFHIFQIVNSTFINLLYCNKLGTIQNSTIRESSCVMLQSLTGFGSTYDTFYSDMRISNLKQFQCLEH